MLNFLILFMSSSDAAFLTATGNRSVRAMWWFNTQPQTYDLSFVDVAEACRLTLYLGAAMHYGGIRKQDEQDLVGKASEVVFELSHLKAVAALV